MILKEEKGNNSKKDIDIPNKEVEIYKITNKRNNNNPPRYNMYLYLFLCRRIINKCHL